MKNLKSILLSSALTLGIFGTTTFISCNPDACSDVVCNNGGTCTDGTCTCAVGFEGTNCDTESRTKLLGSFLMSGTDSDGGTYSNVAVNTSTSSASQTKFIFAVPTIGLNLVCTMTASNAFVVDNQTLSGLTYSGSGTYNGTTLAIALNENDGTGTTVYTWTGNKQ